ncbi:MULTISPECIES: hypothetical protein [unclassified Acinetobacter]|uniref:hypothetical protein n=1 Tax=unclassified Acinetobacter TaxID=196816 RepID=UPI0035B7E1D8
MKLSLQFILKSSVATTLIALSSASFACADHDTHVKTTNKQTNSTTSPVVVPPQNDPHQQHDHQHSHKIKNKA